MDSREKKLQAQRVAQFDKADAVEKKVEEDLAVLENQISGNASQVGRVTRILISRHNKPDVVLESHVLTDWEVRKALEPLLKSKLKELWKLKEEI